MQGIVEMLDEHLQYIEHTLEDGKIIIRVTSKKPSGCCLYCGAESSAVHSVYERKVHDLPIQGKKVTLLISRRKFFCMNKECAKKTFAEQFEFFNGSERKTIRLQEAILEVSLTQSSVSASKYLRKNVADVGKSTICNLLKKREHHNE